MTAARADPRPLSVLQVITGLNVYGAERVALTLARGIAPQGVSSAVMAVASPVDPGPAEAIAASLRAQGVEVIAPWPAAAPPRLQMLGAAWTLRRILRSPAYDLIHVHTDIPEFAAAIGSLRRARGGHARGVRARGVRTLHNTELWPGRPAVARFVERRLAGLVPVAISEGCLDAWSDLRRRIGAEGGPAAQLIRNASSLAPADALSRQDARAALELPADAPTLGFVGRLAAQKGVDVLMQAVRSPLWPTNLGLQVCGDGPMRDLVAAAQAAGAPVRWRGVVNEVSRLYRAFDGLLVPSRFEGAMPLSALDALVLGTPVAATLCPGIADDPTAATMIPIPALTPEAICEAAGAVMGVVGRPPPPLPRDLSAKAMVDAYLALYRRIAAVP